MVGWNVYVNEQWIDKVFFAPNMSADEVKNALVCKDSYYRAIIVRKSNS